MLELVARTAARPYDKPTLLRNAQVRIEPSGSICLNTNGRSGWMSATVEVAGRSEVRVGCQTDFVADGQVLERRHDSISPTCATVMLFMMRRTLPTCRTTSSASPLDRPPDPAGQRDRPVIDVHANARRDGEAFLQGLPRRREELGIRLMRVSCHGWSPYLSCAAASTPGSWRAEPRGARSSRRT
jgi:hypothetical protein